MCSRTAVELVARFADYSCECPDVSVHVNNKGDTCFKIGRMIESGLSSLQIVSDFDHTMSMYMHNGKIVPTSFGILAEDPELNESSRLKLNNLYEKYHPFEVDLKMSIADRIPLMKTWYQQTEKAIIESNLNYDVLKKVVQDCDVKLRNGVSELVCLLNVHKIPMLIFSAGIGDVIQLLLRRFSLELPNVRVISNFMIINDQNTLVDFSRPIICSFCKTAASITNSEYSEVSSSRPCVLLLGDTLGDIHMADGATLCEPEGASSGTVLRIGFLNENVEENLDAFKLAYDIVVVNDDSFTIPLAIVQSIISNSA